MNRSRVWKLHIWMSICEKGSRATCWFSRRWMFWGRGNRRGKTL